MRHVWVLLLCLICGCHEPVPETPPVTWDDPWQQQTQRMSYEIDVQDTEAIESDTVDGVCPDCNGTGSVGDHGVPCTRCNGRPASGLFAIGDRIPRVIIFTADWCAPCTRLKTKLQSLPPDWTQGDTDDKVIQFVDVSKSNDGFTKYGVDACDQLPCIVCYWDSDKYTVATESSTTINIPLWFNGLVATKRLGDVRTGSLEGQFLAELYRVTETQAPLGISVDVSDKISDYKKYYTGALTGKVQVTDGVTIEAPGNLFWSRAEARDGGVVRLIFDQRPKIVAKKGPLKLDTTIQWVDLTKDSATISLRLFPDIKLKL